MQDDKSGLWTILYHVAYDYEYITLFTTPLSDLSHLRDIYTHQNLKNVVTFIVPCNICTS